jgi:very-short-patch-repair endonuclease
MGFSAREVDRRVERGLLHAIHRGVYAVGHQNLPALGTEVAALLAVGPGAVLSHRTAAQLWSLLPGDRDSPVHVSVTRRAPRDRNGIRVHQVRAIDTRRRQGLPVTTVERTLEDIRRNEGRAVAERAANEARLRRLIPTERGDAPTRSEAERALLRLLHRAGLRPDATNVRTEGHEVDVLYRKPRLVVEVDGYAFHGDRASFERDRRRDQDLTAAGYRVIRITWRQLTETPEAVVAAIARAHTAR